MAIWRTQILHRELCWSAIKSNWTSFKLFSWWHGVFAFFSLCLNLIFYRKIDLYSSLKSCAINLFGCSDVGFLNKVIFSPLFCCRSIEFVLNALNLVFEMVWKMHINTKIISLNFAKQILSLINVQTQIKSLFVFMFVCKSFYRCKC